MHRSRHLLEHEVGRCLASRKRPCRFLENVECSGTVSSILKRQNQRYARFNFTSSHSCRSATNAVAVTNDQHAIISSGSIEQDVRCDCNTVLNDRAGRRDQENDRCLRNKWSLGMWSSRSNASEKLSLILLIPSHHAKILPISAQSTGRYFTPYLSSEFFKQYSV